MSTKLEQSDHSALLAISGGVDSIVLLHLLSGGVASVNKNSSTKDSKLIKLIQEFLIKHPITQLELAYIDHSQRDDTKEDLKVIKKLSKDFKLHIVKLDLPKDCSEEVARQKRYQALADIQLKRDLKHLITAHHADDTLETALINLTRGTGPRGLSSLQHQPNRIWRPFLSQFTNGIYIFKQDILDHAQENQLLWHEDSTNSSTKYLRNRVRSKLDSIQPTTKADFLKLISSTSKVTKKIDQDISSLTELLTINTNLYSSDLFKELPEDIQSQFLHKVLSRAGYDIDRASVLRARDFVLTKTTGKVLQLKGCDVVIAQKDAFSVAPARAKVL